MTVEISKFYFPQTVFKFCDRCLTTTTWLTAIIIIELYDRMPAVKYKLPFGTGNSQIDYALNYDRRTNSNCRSLSYLK